MKNRVAVEPQEVIPFPQPRLSVGESQRNLYLDASRGIGMLIVMLHHEVFLHQQLFIPNPIFFMINRTGWLAVDYFFVLSGFFVSGLIFQEYQRTGAFRPLSFIGRRAFKILPSYWLLLIVSVIVYRHNSNLLRKFSHEFLFLQGYLSFHWPPNWSIAVEEHFYLALPLCMVYLIQSKKIDQIPKFVFLLTLFEIMLRIQLGSSVGYSVPTTYYPSYLHMDMLAAGVLLAFYYFLRRDDLQTWWEKYRGALSLTSLVGVGIMIVHYQRSEMQIYTFGYPLLALAFSTVILTTLFPDPKSLLRRDWFRRMTSPFALLGRWSYNIYLWHVFVAWNIAPYVASRFHLSTRKHWAFYCVVSIGLGAFLTIAWEEPFLRLRRRLLPQH